MTPAFAKDRARLLRQELATAGFDVPHSLALELVAHQQALQDWNTLAATDGRRRPAEPYLERETYEHVSNTMTLGELRAVIAGHPDDTPVLVWQPYEPGSATSSGLQAASAVVEPSPLTKLRPALHVAGTHATGKYLVPRRLVLELADLPVGNCPVVDDVIDSVRVVVQELGFRGEWNMSNDDEAGVATWMFQASEGVPLSAVEDAVRRVVRRPNPGTWTLTSR